MGRVHICTGGPDRLVDPAPDCPNASAHTPHPEGYIAHAAWADEMLATHDQEQCPDCHTWSIWVPKASIPGSTDARRS